MYDWKADPRHPFHLRFVAPKGRGEGLDFWAVIPSGDYEVDIERGRAFGREVAEFIRAGGQGFLQQVADAQAAKRQSGFGDRPLPDRPEPTGAVVGFWDEIARQLRR